MADAHAGAAPRSAVAVLIHLLFLLSGASSLIYQVTWTRLLSLALGSDVHAATITLSVFMAGLALGSWLAGGSADRMLRWLLVTYGLLELAIGCAGLALPSVLGGFHDSYKLLYGAYGQDAPWLINGFRTIVAAATMLVPTIAMGATLPLLVRYFSHRSRLAGRTAGALYATNTLGALLGTLSAGFVLMPMLGLSRTMMVAAAISLVTGAVAIVIGIPGRGDPQSAECFAAARSTAGEMVPAHMRRAILAAMALCGLAALALEVVWMRVLVQSYSATVYAFSIMLTCFLFGIGYGSLKASTHADRSAQPAEALSILLYSIAASVCLLAALGAFASPLFAALTWKLNNAMGGAFGAASVAAQFAVAGALIIVPTTLLGAAFPFAVKALSVDSAGSARAAGMSYTANTAGGIIGAMLAGFVLLPMLGVRPSLLVIAGIFACAGFLLSWARGRKASMQLFRRPSVLAGAAIAAAGVVAAVALPAGTVINYGLQRSTRPQLVYHRDGAAHTIDVVRNDAGTTILAINGNIEADTSLVQRRHLVLKAVLPLLLHPRPQRVAVIGLGLGLTLRATAHFPAVEHVRLIELSPEIVEAQRHFRDINEDSLTDPKVALRIDDARNFMTLSDETFDVITTDPIHPRVTGVGQLFTREYFEAIKARLRPGGTVVQWMPMYHVSPRSFDAAFRTFAQAFPAATFWYVRGHGLFVAANSKIVLDCARMAGTFDDARVRQDLSSIGIETPAQLTGHLLMDPQRVQAYLARAADRRVNTDDNAYLEYNTPFEFLARPDDIVPELLRHAGWNEAHLRDCTPQQRIEARAAFAERLARIVPELNEPLR
jgi:spermidine synthase